MEPLTIVAIMFGLSCANNIYDYIAFTNKHRETQLEIKYLKEEILSLNNCICNMRNEIRKNNKIIKNLENTIRNESR
jgi:hypothetical protein